MFVAVIPCLPLGGSQLWHLSAAHATEEAERGSVTKFKVQPLYKAVKVSWRAKVESGDPVTFEIHRSMFKSEGPYTLVATVEWDPASKKYQYVDKNLPVEENYFYKIVIPATAESFGPLQVRPPFSLPTT
jgi:hypothetical protein